MNFVLISLLLFSCRNSSGTAAQETSEFDVEPETVLKTESYTSLKWHFATEIPQGFESYEGQLAGETPVINFYDPEIKGEPPFAIHNDAQDAYIAVLPHGFGVDAPGGPRKSFDQWEGYLPLEFEVDPTKSYVYLMESGAPWALSLGFYHPPKDWNEYGSINVFYEVNDFRAECFSGDTGEEITMAACNPMQGDAMKFYGEVSPEKEEALNSILKSLYFTDPNRGREEIGDLIKLEQPQEKMRVASPLRISGEARGYWFFEASAPVRLIDERGNLISEKYITATEDWMTEEWVTFKGELEFETKEKRGYLVLNRANASGKPEHDRVLRVPVLYD